ncbi:uncharacterized protein LTR77_006331 [Saxophila tyrrhenica]|uniref:BRCT domain-containing protein n=1 Tax=Saxophila tyrrhenica TaxID=1690608 RepID=A0AAV9PBI4_9PEZI|nr:hypothetical protein LTR77_006331 [Saxophila tyrrhenica]
MPTSAPKPAKPKISPSWDAFNSSATGHQRADNRLGGSTSWRKSRTLKLHQQFYGGAGGGKRVSDTVGAGSLDFGKDGRTENGGWVKGASGLRKGGQQSILDAGGVKVEKDVERPAKRVKTGQVDDEATKVTNPFTPFKREDGSIREASWTSHETSPSHLLSPINSSNTSQTPTVEETAEDTGENELPPPQIFAGLVLYVNGNCGEDISDHKLKRIWYEHGGQTSIHLARRTVSHVVIGRPNSNGGSGGGLAGSKIQKEVAKKGGPVVKFVTAEWVTESIKAGRRLPESRFAALSFAPQGVTSVASMFGQKTNSPAQASKGKG